MVRDGLSASASGVRPRVGGLSAGAAAVAMFACCQMAGRPVVADSGAGGPPHLRRVVHRFDFDERALGNYESMPMHWEQLEEPEFPGFATSGFDDEIGRTAPPSFRLSSDGRNVACWYRGPNTPARPSSEYLVVGWIRPQRLAHARAALSAYYLDRRGLPIAGTQVFSPLVGGPGGDDGWQRVAIHLPAGPPQVCSIGLTAWVVQADIWDDRARPHRHIELHDLRAAAWFDDLTIYRMPSAVLTTPAPGGIFVAPDAPVLHATVADIDAAGLSARLIVQHLDGNVVQEAEIPVQTERRPRPTVIRLAGLDPGVYEGTLEIRTGDETVLARRLRFAQLAQSQYRAAGVAEPFGVSLDPFHRAPTRDEFAYLSALAVGAVKVPVWPADPSTTPENTSGQVHGDLLYELVKARVALTAVLGAPPAGLVQSAGPYARSLLEILADDPAGWRPHLAAAAAAHASVFHSWQVGADRDPNIPDDPLLPDALRQVRREMTPLITTVSLTVPGDAALAAGDTILPAEETTLRVAGDVHDDWIAAYLADYRSLAYERVSAHVEMPPAAGYARLPWLAAVAQRIIRTRHAGVDTVYASQLWRTRPTISGPVAEPLESFVVYRTIVDLLRDRAPGPEMHLDSGVIALAFQDVDTAVLALWEPSAPPEGRLHEVHVGSARRQVDLWGRSVPLEPGAEGRSRVRLFPQPVFVDQVDRWLVDFVAAARLSPDRAELTLLPRTHLLELSNAGKHQLAGQVTLEVPEEWEVRPQRFGFRISPHAGFEQPIEFRFGHNEPAGPKRITARVDFETDPAYHLTIPLTLELGIANVDVWGFAFLEGDRLVLRHGVTNRLSEALSFRTSATVPGRSRQFRVVPALGPGETTIAEYRFDRAAPLAGRTVRLGLREVDGPRKHTIELTAP